GFHGRRRAEVDVRYQRYVDAPGAEATLDFADCFGIGSRRSGDPDDLAASVYQANCLRQRGVDVLGTGGGHRLHADGLRAADGDIANSDFPRHASLVGEAAGTVAERAG